MIEEPKIRESIIKCLDPRTKILSVFLFSVIVAVSYRLTTLFFALAISLIIIIASKAYAKEVFKRLVPVNLIVILLWFFLPFTVKGEPVCSLGPLSITGEGLFYATRITIKSNTMMLMLIALISSTSVLTIGHAMHDMFIPKKLVHLLFFTFRYIYIIYDEYLRIEKALKVRCFVPKTSLHTYKTYAFMVGMLLVKSFDRAQRVYNAMLCRGFNGNFYCLNTFSLAKKDYFSFCIMCGAIFIMGVLEWKKTGL